MSRLAWAWLRMLGGVLILVAVVWRLGAGPLLDGLRSISVGAVLGAAALTAGTTVCAAWRWQAVARGLGLRLGFGAAVAAYYRSQFLNTVLPGGVVGDVHRGVDHGRDSGEVGLGLRAVAWERFAGQVVQFGMTGLVLLTVLLAANSAQMAVAFVAIGGTLAAVLLCLVRPRIAMTAPRIALGRVDRPTAGAPLWRRAVRGAAADVRGGLLARSAWPVVLLASALIVAGHTGTFLIAARASGSQASTLRMLPIALIVLMAMAIPLNIGGWGPREGAAAWLFGFAGLGARGGVSAAAAYGVLVLAASLPGAVVLIGSALRRRRARPAGRPGDAAAQPRLGAPLPAEAAAAPASWRQGAAHG